MATASDFLTEDQFLCSICLDVFSDPVTIPCGHNFCKNCITEHWNIDVKCQCPMCKELFDRRPKLRVNTFISEIAAQLRKSDAKDISSSLEQQQVKPGDVLCDVCSKPKLKALKSCLVCLTSYCETHLDPHHRLPGLKRHQLIKPVRNLEDRMCKKHERPLDLFCQTDQMCVCQVCLIRDHKLHHIVPLEEEYEKKKAEMGETEAEVQQMIQERRLKVEQIKQSVKHSKEDADRETADSVQVFTAHIVTVKKGLAELIDMIEQKQKTTEQQAKGFIKELEMEISELLRRHAEVEQLSSTEDHLQLLQGYSSLNPTPPIKDWRKVKVYSSCGGMAWRAAAQLEETLSKEIRKLCADAELKRVQQYTVDVTLDPDTANPYLILSADGKRVSCGDVKKSLPDNPERLSSCAVLGVQSFSSGRFYYEVQVKGKTKWDLGVTRQSVNRKGENMLCPENGYWAIWLRNQNEYRALAGPSICLSLKSKPQKVGVFVDYGEGLVFFYDVNAADLIYCFTDCNFTEKIYPYFNPGPSDGGKNSLPMIITSVSQRH